MSNVFLVSFRREQGGPVLERLYFGVGTVVWPFAQRIWRELRGEIPMPGDLEPLMLLRPPMSAPIRDLPAAAPSKDWDLALLDNPRLALVEFILERPTEVVQHAYYRLHDIFGPVLANLLDDFYTRRELRFSPGRYFYEVLLVRLGKTSALKKESAIFSEGSFELPILDDGDPLLDFQKLDDSPLAPAVKKRPLFLVPGRRRVGDTRFGNLAWHQLATQLPMPLDREIGGYLVGSVGEGDNGEETVTIHQAVPAELSTGDAHTLLMSPESGAEIRRRIAAEWPGEELVGWYHTHIFSAKNDVLSGLSSIDEKTHDEQFTRSWQLAVLVNIWRDAGTVCRQVRVFRRDGQKKLVDVDYSVVAEGDLP